MTSPLISSSPAASENETLAAVLRPMQDDPIAIRTLVAWQTITVDAISAVIDTVTARLVADVPAVSPLGHVSVSATRTGHYDVVAARSQARRRATLVQECRTLAEDIVFASLRHLDDTHWDPLADTPGTEQLPPSDNLLLMLLDLAQPDR